MAFIEITAFHDRWFDGFKGEMLTDEVAIAWPGRRWLWCDNDWHSAYPKDYEESATEAVLKFIMEQARG